MAHDGQERIEALARPMNYLLRVETGRELAAARSAHDAGLSVQCPTRTVEVRKKRWHRLSQRFVRARRPVIEDSPILPGYLFASIPDADFHKLEDVKHVFGHYRMGERDRRDVERFMRRVDRGDFNHDGSFGGLKAGQIMRLVGGVFDQMIVSFRHMAGERVVVEAGLLGSTTRMEVSVDGVEVVR